MACSDSSLEPWWISEAFSRDTEALTRALQQSLYSNTAQQTITDTAYDQLFLNTQTQPIIVHNNTTSDIYPKQQGRRNATNALFISNGKVSKRKSRASKRATTTFIAADPSNFRQMVQQVTGIQSSILKPEPRVQSYALPTTLDTSECWLGPANGPDGGSSGSFHNFPTLESWP